MITNLSWGIKNSFLNYIESLPDCRIATNDGSFRDEQTGAFVFPYTGRTELDGDDYRLEFAGDVRMQAHGGMLLIIFMNPWLTFSENGVELSVVDLMYWPDTSKREVLGTSGAAEGSEFPLALTASALETFNNVYQAGEPLAPAKLV